MIDIIITQDVLEHVYNATAVFHEIYRTLQPGGIHIFTVPTTAKQFPTFQAVTRIDSNHHQDLQQQQQQHSSGNNNSTKKSLIMLHNYPEIHG